MSNMIIFIISVVALIISVVLAQGALLWLIAYMLAPAENDFSLERGIVVGLGLSVFSFMSQTFIEPKAGSDWTILTDFLLTLFVIWVGFRLSFWRTILAVIIFWTIAGLVIYFLTH